MEKVFNNNKLGKIFMYIASIFFIVASTLSFVLLLIDNIPELALILAGDTATDGGMRSTMYLDLVGLLVPVAFVLVQLIVAIVCVVKNKKHGSIKISSTVSVVAITFILLYLILVVYNIPASIMNSDLSNSKDILGMFNFVQLIVPFLFSIVASILFAKIKRNRKKNRKPILNKILSVALIAVAIIFLLVDMNAHILDLGGGIFAKIAFILGLVSLFLFLVEGFVSIVYLILNRASLHTNVNPNLECELVKEEANYKLEKRYLERGNKSVASLVFSVIFICLVGATLIWELISYIPNVSDAFDFANTVTDSARLSATIMALYRCTLLFLLVGLIVYFAYSATYFMLGQKGKYYKLNNFILLQGLFVLFAHFVPVVYDTIELMGFAIENPIILLPILATAIFAILSIVSLVLSSKANKQMKNGERSAELMKSLAISNTILMCASILMFIVACIYTFSLQYIPAFVGLIVLCVLLWVQVKHPREEYFLVKTETQQPQVKEEPENINQEA